MTFDEILEDIFGRYPKTMAALAKAEHAEACKLCAVGDEPIKMKRQWVHHFPDVGRIVVCDARTLKRGAC